MHFKSNSILIQQQRGIALIVALILLVVITLLGLGAMRGTTFMQKIMGNFYDRETAFQSAEGGLTAGAAALAAGTTNIRNCGPGGVSCPSNPFNDSTASANIFTVDPGLFSFSLRPQYIIENLGTWPDPSSSTGFGQTANSAQYGAQGATTTAVYYRITARSADPAVMDSDRAVVTLQAMYKQ